MVNSKFRSHLLETRLAARECQLELAAQTTELGLWSLEPTTGELSWSPRCQALMGVAADAPALFESLVARVHVEDQARVRKAFSQALQFKREFTVEFRVQTGGDTAQRVRCSGRPHVSAVNRQQPALSGVLQSLASAAGDAAPGASRIGSVVQRLESLHELERNTLISRMQSEVSLTLEQLRQQLDMLANRHGVAADLQQDLTGLAVEAGNGLEAVRSALFELRPPGVAELGFAGALERYAIEQAAAAGITLALTLPQEPPPVGMPTLESLYVVARTGIDNVVRHARAHRMSVTVTCDQDELVLKIEDDGVGITNADLAKDSAFSLFASSERLANSGGELRVSGSAARGTTLEATIALRDKVRPLRSNVTPLRVA